MSFPRYPKYKDSGVEWLGAVPEHWDVKRLGSIYRQGNESGEDHLAILCVSIHDGVSDKELGEEEMDRKVTRSDDRSKYKKVEPGDLVYNMMRAWQGGFGAVAVQGMVSPAYVVARPTSAFSTVFIEHLLRTPQAIEQMRRYSQGVTDFRLRLYWEEFKTISIVLPPSDEQVAIIEFLEQETSKIDALVAEQQRLIELLKEKRQAVISHAVTKGLNPHAPMKPSGIECHGDIPAHWWSTPLKHLTTIKTGYAFSSDDFVENGTPVLRIGDITSDGRVDLSNARYLPEEFATTHHKVLVLNGDIVMAMTGATIGKSGWYGLDEAALLNQRVCVFRAVRPNLQRYLWYILNTGFYSEYVTLTAFGGAQPNISDSELLRCSVPLPPVSEQLAISEFLDAEMTKLDALTAEAQRAIDLLQERRTALISAAVTGQIDVRQFAENEIAA